MQIVSVKEFHSWIIVLVLLASPGRSLAETVSFKWDASGTPDVIGYNIYYGTLSGDYSHQITVGNTTTATISNLTCGETYFFAATGFNSQGIESGFSNEAQFLVPGIVVLSRGPTPGDPVTIKFPVMVSRSYEVQASTDLKSWNTVWQTGVATSNAWVQFSDPQAGEFPTRFYRLVHY